MEGESKGESIVGNEERPLGQEVEEERPIKSADQNGGQPVSEHTHHHAETENEQQSNRLMVAPVEPAIEESCFSYGKNVVLLKTKWLTVFLGPDYICFLVTFLFFAVISFLIITYIDRVAESVLFKVVTKIVCIGQCLSYLLVATSDPGIAHPLRQQNKGPIGRTIFCRKCRFHVPSKTIHCVYCDVCIEGYDHHCPWTSKCIGRNNLIRFYVFLFMTPIYIVYCAFAFGFTLDNGTPNRQPHLTTSGKP